MKRLTVLAALLALLLAGCGQKKNTLTASAADAQPFTVMLDWFPNADHVGLFQALAKGDFTQAGLAVHVQNPSDPSLPLKLLAAGKVDAAISYEPEVLLARDQGMQVVSVAAIVQKPLTSIVSLAASHITSAARLRGKRVGDAGIPYQHAYLTTILHHAGVPTGSVKEINVGADLVPALLSGRLDAVLGAYWNYEAIQLAQMHKRVDVLRMDQVGVPSYDELVVAVRASTIINHPDVVRRFVQALARGYESARADPVGAVDDLVSANPGLDQKLQLASVRATMPVFFPAGSHPWGWQDPAQWSAYGQWMLSHHLISNPNTPIGASTNELLAGQGVG